MLRTHQPSVMPGKILGVLSLVCAIALPLHRLWAQAAAQTSTPQSAISLESVTGTQSTYLGSVPTGKATAGPLPLSINEALERGLKYNLALIESDVATRTARAGRLQSLSALLPNINGAVSQNIQQVNLRAEGLNFNIPGFPTIVGPFSFQDARVSLSQKVLDWNALQSLRATTERLRSSQYSYKNSRDIVVLVVGNAYLQVIADAATVQSQQAQVKTSQALYKRAHDQRTAGVAARIDELRAQVELQTQQQRLISAQNQLEKDKLSLARIIGLPPGQQFTLTDTVPYRPLQGVTLEKALQDAYANRSDYLSAKSEARAAELARKAAVAERYPSLTTNTSYGDIGPNFAHSHGTVTFAGTLNVPIFQGGRVRADVLQADAALQQRRAQLEDLRGRIDNDVRSAFLDIRAADDLVKVAKSNMDLASETLTQAQDRFAAGVTDNIEVVQAQESVASANQSYISSLYTFNIAKVELARAAGIAEQAVRAYLGGK